MNYKESFLGECLITYKIMVKNKKTQSREISYDAVSLLKVGVFFVLLRIHEEAFL